MSGYPSRSEAERILETSVPMNPGPWGDHSRAVAHAAEKIAAACGMDPDKAYILGLLHDIGRRYGTHHITHISDGCRFMLELGYPDVAKICITHSYNVHDIDNDVAPEDKDSPERIYAEKMLKSYDFDDYDRLIQLCDSIGMAEGLAPIEVRMWDVKDRYGRYPDEKWQKNLDLKAYFEEKCGGRDLYEVIGEVPFGVRQASTSDLPEMLRIYDKARGFMVSAGNERQWGAAYHNGVAWPPASVLEQDIAAGKSFVCQYGSRVVGTFYLTEGPDPTYAVIDGAWISDAPYSVVHRIATDGSVRGIGAYCVQWALKRTGHLRIDTHGDNKPMQRLMEKLGFTYCGIIHVEEDDDPRMAYEKVNGCAITS